MNRIENEGPPRWALAFFRWFCHPEIREYTEGDLLELYHQRRAGLGLTKAKWLLIKDIFLLFRPGIIGNSNSRLQQFSIMKNIKWTRLVLINLLVGLMILSLEEIVMYDKDNISQAVAANGNYNYHIDAWRVQGALPFMIPNIPTGNIITAFNQTISPV